MERMNTEAEEIPKESLISKQNVESLDKRLNCKKENFPGVHFIKIYNLINSTDWMQKTQ